MRRVVAAALFSLLWSLWFTSSLQAQAEPFYKGKTVRVVVGTTPGGGVDLWARAIARYWTRHIPGSPEFIVQNMPGAGSMIAANYVYNVAKPDGLTLGLLLPALFFDQMVGRKEVQFDWAKFAWIGSPEETDEMLFMRSDSPYKTLEDIRKATVPPRCGTTGTGATSYYFPKLLEETLGLKFHIITGYPGAMEVDLAIEKGEMHCRAGTISAFFGREQGRTWAKTGFVRMLVQGGTKRDPRIADVSTIWELMEKEKTPETARRVATVILSPGSFGRPFVGSPGIPGDRVRILRESFMKTMSDPELLAEAKTRGWEVNPASGEKLEALAKEVVAQPPEVISRMNAVLGR